jgi:hypothetical protein
LEFADENSRDDAAAKTPKSANDDDDKRWYQ